MALCHFCRRKFRSPQGVKSHLKRCSQYKAVKNQESSPLGRAPKGAAKPAATPFIPFGPEVAQPNLSAPLVDPMKLLAESMAKLNEPPSAQQQRRKVLQSAKGHVIGHYYTASGIVTPAMRGAAKLGIERELATLPLEALPFEEVLELAIAIRDRGYARAFREQAQEAARLRVEQDAQRRKDVDALGALLRASRRKRLLIQQASHQTLAYCEEKQISGMAQLSLVGDIESRLDEFLTGDESVPEAQVIMQWVLEARFAEADARLAAARAKQEQKWWDDAAGLVVIGGLVVVPVLAAMYPTQTAQLCAWLERTFGWNAAAAAGPTPHATPESAASSASASAPPPRRRWRKTAAPSFSPGFSPWGHPSAPTTHGSAPHGPEEPVSIPLSARGADGLAP